MINTSKLIQGLGIPFSALTSIVVGMMLISFPIGLFVVFNSDIGNDITFDFPINDLDFFKSMKIDLPLEISIGDIFIGLWILYAIFFTLGLIGPRKNFLKVLIPIISNGKLEIEQNYVMSALFWFSILILSSAIITYSQEFFGIETTPPSSDNSLVQFLLISISPITEELGFRMILIGLPLFLFYSNRFSVKTFFKSIWSPYENFNLHENKKPFILILIVGVLFGASHILIGEPWSNGKFAQATVSGIILGWVYYRFGFISAVLIHWGTNYFVYSYGNLISQLSQVSIDQAFTSPMINTLEFILIIYGIISLSILFYSRQSRKNLYPSDLTSDPKF